MKHQQFAIQRLYQQAMATAGQRQGELDGRVEQKPQQQRRDDFKQGALDAVAATRLEKLVDDEFVDDL
ncbi:hypothetical protein D9M71_597390 [compost metagenome]